MSFSNLLLPLSFASGLLVIVSGGAWLTIQEWAWHLSASSESASDSRDYVYDERLRNAPVIRTAQTRYHDQASNAQQTASALQVEKDTTMTHVRLPKQPLESIESDDVLTADATASTPEKTSSELKPTYVKHLVYHPPTYVVPKAHPSQPRAVANDDLIEEVVRHRAEDADGLVPMMVMYDKELVIEFPKAIATSRNIKHAVSRVLLSASPLTDFDLLSSGRLDLSQRPYLYRKVLDHNQQPIRYPKHAFNYINYLMEEGLEKTQDLEGEFVVVRMPMVESGLRGPAKNFQAWVRNYADEFNVSPALVYAVMETESSFNPRAISRSNAIGLMQVKANAAGRDVYQYIDEKPGQPSRADLLNSQNNIRMGTAYLSLLKHDYLSAVEEDKIRQMLTISSYNGGIKTVLDLFGKTPDAAMQRINRMTPRQVYRKLRYDHHSDETRRYLDKVLQAETKYKELLNEV